MNELRKCQAQPVCGDEIFDFHCWGNTVLGTLDGCFNNYHPATIAIVEDQNGKIQTFSPTQIKFITK